MKGLAPRQEVFILSYRQWGRKGTEYFGWGWRRWKMPKRYLGGRNDRTGQLFACRVTLREEGVWGGRPISSSVDGKGGDAVHLHHRRPPHAPRGSSGTRDRVFGASGQGPWLRAVVSGLGQRDLQEGFRKAEGTLKRGGPKSAFDADRSPVWKPPKMVCWSQFLIFRPQCVTDVLCQAL